MSSKKTEDVMFSLLALARVRESLQFLADVGVVQQESVLKGCRKFVKDHPEINEHFKEQGHD